MHVQAHKISERIHDINLLGLNAETVGKVSLISFAVARPTCILLPVYRPALENINSGKFRV